MRILALLILCWLPAQACAQQTPLVTVEMTQTETVLGQPLTVRIKVLVPTFSPAPPEFPSLEIPGVLVRLPERASGPISEDVNGETWSGVQRSYRVYPLRPGEFEIPAQTVRITYAQEGGIDPIVVDLNTDAISFVATIPPGAENLDPMIVANGFSMTQTLDPPQDFEVGDAITRTVQANIAGTTGILIPSLVGENTSITLRAYPKDPDVSDSEERGVLSGTRTETITYLGVRPGDAVLPPIAVDWFNLQTGQVETTRVDGVTFAVTGSAASLSGRNNGTGLWVAIVVGLILCGVLAWVLRARLRHRMTTVRNRWNNSEWSASRRVHAAINARDLSVVYTALNAWLKHHPHSNPDALNAVLARIGRARYAPRSDAGPDAIWADLSRQFREFRRRYRVQARHTQGASALPRLN
ncbi:MAG: hypothetical protein AAF625_07180 [Pseudomonadota bacterium]